MTATPTAANAISSQSRHVARSPKTNTPIISTHTGAVHCSQIALAAKGNGPAQRAVVKTVQEIEAEARAHGTIGVTSKKPNKDLNDITDQELMAILRQNKITEA